MTRAGFGGSGDYSGLFSGLYSSNKQTKDAQQAADDQDAYDKWQNGLSSDQEWLSYIKARVDATAGTPKEQQKWVDNLRKYSVVISDNQAEFAYKNGGSINDLVAYYQTRLTKLDKGSTEYRDLQLRTNDLIDQRSSDSITDGAQALIDGINKGTKTYAQLKSFLSAKMGETRPNSDLRNSLEKQLKQVNEQIRTNKLEGSFERLQYQYDAGKLSGTAYAAHLRQMAVQFKDSDPKRYYQILEAAVQLNKNAAAHSRSAGNKARNKTLNAAVDSVQAKRNLLQAQLKQFDEAGGRIGSSGIDPRTGKAIVFTEAKVHELDIALLKTFDQLSAAYTAKGDKSAAANAQKAKMTFVSGTIVKHNTMAADDQSRELLQATNKVLLAAQDDPDPTSAMNRLRLVAKSWDEFAKGQVQNKSKTKSFAGDAQRRLPNEAGETTFTGRKGLLDSVDTDFSARSAGFAAALKTLTTPGIDDASAAAALEQIKLLEGGGGGSQGGGQTTGALTTIARGILQVAGNEQGLATGDVSRVIQAGQVSFVRNSTVSQSTIDPNGNAVTVQKKVPAVDGINGKDTKLVDIFVDINGVPTKVQAVAQNTDVEGFNAWSSAKVITLPDGTKIPPGRALTQGQIKAIGKDFANLVNGGSIKPKSALSAWTVSVPGYTDAHGQSHPSSVWTQDKDTGLWYQGSLPIRGAQRDDAGMVKYGDDNQPQLDWKSFASAAGVPAPYAGNDPKAMQNLMDSNQVNVDGIRGRDVTGAVSQDTPGLGVSYYNPLNANLTDPSRRDSWWQDEERQQRADDEKQKVVSSQRAALSHNESVLKANLSDDEYAAHQRKQAGDMLKAAADASGVSAFAKGLDDFAKSLGINLSGTPAKSAPIGGKSLTKDQQAARLGEIPLPTKKASAAPLVTLPTPNAYSGPTLKSEVDLAIPAASSKFNPKIPKEDVVVTPKPKKETAATVAATRTAPADMSKSVSAGPTGGKRSL